MKKLSRTIWLGGIMGLLFPVASMATTCTTMLWIDEDCDGYVTGGKDGAWYTQFPGMPIPLNNDPDANDNRVDLNTPQSVLVAYGDFTNIQNFKNYLTGIRLKTREIQLFYWIEYLGWADGI